MYNFIYKKISKVFSIISVFILILFASCTQQFLEPSENGQAEVFFKALFNGQYLTYQSGAASIFTNSFNQITDNDSLLIYHFVLDDLKNSSVRYIDISINNFVYPFKSFTDDINSSIKPGMYKYRVMGPNPGNPKRLSEVTITWNNEKMEVFSSIYLPQKQSDFTIISVKDTILKLQKGSISVKKAKITFNCMLRNSQTSDTINISKGEMNAIFLKNN